MTLRYREHAPHEALASRVRCYWTARGHGATERPVTSRVLPDGCMDLIFDLRTDASRGAVVVGTMLRASVIHHPGMVDLLGVRFVPGAAPLFLRSPAVELTNAEVDALLFLPDIDELWCRLAEVPATQDRAQRLNAYLLGRMGTASHSQPALQGMALIERAHGQIRVDRLCHSLNVSERSLQRVFASHVGITPKQAIRTMRFRHAVMRMRAGPSPSLAAVAHSCGYADQPHFTRDFHELAGLTPTEYIREAKLVGFVQDDRDTDR